MRITLTGPRLVLAAVLVLVVSLVTASSSAPFPAGTRDLRATLRMVSERVQCPPDAPSDAFECRARTGEGSVSGLGSVSEAYSWSFRVGPPTCDSNLGKPLATTGRLVVARKGEINFAVAEGARCVDVEPLRNEPQDFTITGGTGIYDGASGSGTLERTLGASLGRETWTGTLVVAGLEFDVTPPTLSGTRSKTVRARKGAKRAGVTYNVTAADAVDGRVPVTCRQSIPDRPHRRQLLGHGLERQHTEGIVQGHREEAMRRAGERGQRLTIQPQSAGLASVGLGTSVSLTEQKRR
jgi:hypothetical protein